MRTQNFLHGGINLNNSRKAKVDISYNGKNITSHINQYVSSVTYTDVASGSSDTISLNLIDREKKWIGCWMPSKNDTIEVKIYLHNWDEPGTKTVFKCGTFTIDDLSFSGRPLVAKIGAAASPQSQSFNVTKRTKTWEKVSLKEIAKTVAERSKLTLYFDADNVSIKKIEQNKEEDCKFLYSLCETYGLAMKVYNKKLIIYDEEKYERKSTIATIKESESEVISWSYNTTLTGTYTGARVSYSDPVTDKTEIVNIGSGDRILDVNVSASDKADAEKKGKAKLRAENKKATTMSISLFGNFKITASSCVKLEEFRQLSGKYFVTQVKHRVDSSERTTTDLELRLIE